MLMAADGLHCDGFELAVVAVDFTSRVGVDASLGIAGPGAGPDEDDSHRVFLSSRTQWEPFSLFPECFDCYYS